MSVSLMLLSILSGICLLLWGLRSVKRAVLRGYGGHVQKAIAKGTRNRVFAVLSGIITTLFLQSSTATALLTASFVERGIMVAAAGLAVMIGADIGTAIVAQLLSFKITWLAPLLLSSGIMYHLAFDNGGRERYGARIVIGLGFMLMALSIIRDASAPLAHSEVLPLILAPLEREPILAVMVAAILTYLFHSGLSSVLLFASLAYSGVLSLDLALVFVVGANIGGGIIPVIAVAKDTPRAMQIPIANLFMRVSIGIIALIFKPLILQYIALIPVDDAHKVVFAHIGFSVVLAIVFTPFVYNLASLFERILPGAAETEKDKELKPRYLDMKALNTPAIAISCAMREALHMSEVLGKMLRQSFDALHKDDIVAIKMIRSTDDHLDALFMATKDYMIRLTREELDDEEAEQSHLIISFVTNLEHCGDIIDKSLMEIAESRIKNKDRFSDEGLAEIKAIYEKVVENLQIAQTVFMSSDRLLAETLIQEKAALKKAELRSERNHLQRLREGLPQSIATSGLHMDIIRDYRRINTYITSVAYTVSYEEKAE